jgi:MFS family permease
MSIRLLALVSGTVIDLHPKSTALPGTAELRQLADGVDLWALIAAGVGILVGAVLWAFGHYSQNYQQAYNGRRGVMVSGLAALLIGGASEIVTFFAHKGGAIK